MPSNSDTSTEGATGGTQALAPPVAKFIELLHSVPTLDTNYTHRNLLVEDPGVFGQEQFNGTAHLIAIVNHVIGKDKRVDYLIDNAMLFAGVNTELAARLDAWRAPLKQPQVQAPAGPDAGVGPDVEKTSDGLTYVHLSWRTVLDRPGPDGRPIKSPLRGEVPPAWSARISYRRWGEGVKEQLYPARAPWSVPRPWLRTLQCKRQFYVEGQREPEFEEVVHFVPPLQPTVAFVLFLALVGFAVGSFLLLIKLEGFTEVPWGSAAAFLAIVVALPPLHPVRVRLRDWWVAARLELVALGTMVAIILWFLVHASFFGLQAGRDALLCDGHPWDAKRWRVFPRWIAKDDGSLPGGCSLVSTKPAKKDCPRFTPKKIGASDFDTLGLWFFGLPASAAKVGDDERGSCEEEPARPVHTLVSCSDGLLQISIRPNKGAKPNLQPLQPGEARGVPQDAIAVEYDRRLNNQLNAMEFWSIGPPVGDPTKNVAIRIADRLIGTITDPPSERFRWLPNLDERPNCRPPETLVLKSGSQKLTATGPFGEKGQGLHRVKLNLGERNLRALKFYPESFVQQIEGVSGDSGDDASAWIVDVLKENATVEATINDRPARICMKCPRKPGPHDLCVLHKERTTPTFDPKTGVAGVATSCGP